MAVSCNHDISNRELFNIWKENKNDINGLCNYISDKLLLDGDEDITQNECLKANLNVFLSKVRAKWNKSSRNQSAFERNNGQWLEASFSLPVGLCMCTKIIRKRVPENQSLGGRPEKAFEDLDDRSKRRRTADIRNERGPYELAFAAQTSYRAAGNVDAANLISLAMSNPTDTQKELNDLRQSKVPVTLTPEEALSLMVETGLSKSQYLVIRRIAKEKHADIFPAYEHILAAKESCRPPKDAITISESKAEVRLDALLDHTAKRILSTCEPPLDTTIPRELIMISKLGCDGSSGYSQYKQKAQDKNQNCDSHLFSVTLSPLQIYQEREESTSLEQEPRKVVFYQNPSPSSTLSCRPVKLIWSKETPELTKAVCEEIKEVLREMRPTVIDRVIINHRVSLTMVDMKVCNTLTDTKSAQCCYLCKAPPSLMNDIDDVKSRTVNEDALEFGIAPLHAAIRSFEYFLHIGYKIESQERRKSFDHLFNNRNLTKTQKQQLRIENEAYLEQEKKLIQERKTKIQAEFWDKMGLRIDQPRPGGYGNSNDGNTARRFFSEPDLSASILGVDAPLLTRFSTILAVISSASEVDTCAYEKYATETAKLCVALYGWYTMPPTVHKILIHGAAIMSALPLPVGQFSEEAQEKRHKDCKKIKIYNTRKSSREKGNEDLLNALLVSSCPLITGLRIKTTMKKEFPQTEELASLLKKSEIR